MNLKRIFTYLPEVTRPKEHRVSFNTKLKWTLIVLIVFFIFANTPLFGIEENTLQRFEYLAVVLGTSFGSIITLGIGPIVLASIILQLFVGSGILEIDTTTTEGKKLFTGIQKILVLFLIVFESIVLVSMGGLRAIPGLEGIVMIQLIIGGLIIFYLDDVVQKWGFGSGISLFIVAGISWRIFTGLFQFINQQGQNCLLNFGSVGCSGRILVMIQSLITNPPNITGFLSAAATVASTIVIYLLVVWAQSLKVEIPLSYSRLRGYSIKWPLAFFYTSVTPVILTAALIANLQLIAGGIENSASACMIDGITINRSLESCTGISKISSYLLFLGRFSQGQPVSGLAYWIGGYNNLLESIIRGSLTSTDLLRGFFHILTFIILSTLFAVLWVKTSGMDAASQAHKIASSGLGLSGFRKDERVLESILDRYIMPLTIMGGIGIGLLASFTDLFGALSSGTGILLAVMIIYKLYEEIAQQHAVDMHPAIRKFMKQ